MNAMAGQCLHDTRKRRSRSTSVSIRARAIRSSTTVIHRSRRDFSAIIQYPAACLGGHNRYNLRFPFIGMLCHSGP
jgi:hypothetical protein